MPTLDPLTLSRDALDALNCAQDQARIADLEARLDVAYGTLESQAKAHQVSIVQLCGEADRLRSALAWSLKVGLRVKSDGALRTYQWDDNAVPDDLHEAIESARAEAIKESPHG